jgi:hypothetical protein
VAGAAKADLGLGVERKAASFELYSGYAEPILPDRRGGICGLRHKVSASAAAKPVGAWGADGFGAQMEDARSRPAGGKGKSRNDGEPVESDGVGVVVVADMAGGDQ